MRISEIVEHINEIERQIPVQEWRIDGVDIWPTVRVGLYFDLFEHANFSNNQCGGSSGKVERIFSFGLRLLKFFFSVTRLILRGKWLSRSELGKGDALFLDDPSYIFVGGRRYQRFCDPVIEELRKNNKAAYILSLSENAYGNTTTPSVYVLGQLQLSKIFAILKLKIFPRKRNINLLGLDEYNAYIQKIGRGARKVDKQTLIRDVSLFLSMTAYFKKLLSKAAPTACFVVCYYDSYHMAFIHACHQLNIPTIDLQHGVVNQYHVAYGRWMNVPKQGYNTVPNYFACWDQASANCINDWGMADGSFVHQGVVIGNKFLEKMYLEQKKETADFLEFFNKIQDEHKPIKNVILAMQNKYLLMDVLKDILSAAPKSIFWWIRIHPMTTSAEMQSILLGLGEIKGLLYDVKQSSSHHLYSVLPYMDVNITLNSSVVIEASEFGIPSVICEDLGFEYYQAMIESGEAYAAYTVEDAVSLLMNLNRKERVPSRQSSDDLYKKVGLI